MDINRPRLPAARRAGLLLVTLTGCTVGPNYKPPQIHVNPAYGEMENPATTRPSRTVSRSMPLVEWWTTFNDPQLDSLIERAAKSNLDLRRTGARVLEARAQRAITVGGTYPNLDFTGSATKNRLSKNGIPIPTGASGGAAGAASGGLGTATPALARPNAASSSQGGGISSLLSKSELDLYQLGFDASWELDLFGGLRRGVQAASADLAASVEDRRDALVTLLAEVARDYIDLRGVQRRQALAEENLQAQRQTLDLIRSKHKAGFSTDLDVARQS
ncbi:MAG TPA: TolC family protein, partial [Acidobacteriaceae bacterium]|nr:TolC family protein [Acidobacteriaceae bacterium]